jgi:hypothetical protein
MPSPKYPPGTKCRPRSFGRCATPSGSEIPCP